MMRNNTKNLKKVLTKKIQECIISKRSAFGQVAEWLKAADCKSVLIRVRWFESIPVHHKRGSNQNYLFFILVYDSKCTIYAFSSHDKRRIILKK